MKKVIGYGYKLSSESLDDVIESYYPIYSQLHGTKKEVLDWIKIDKERGNIPKTAKPKIFKVLFEVES